MIQRHYKNMVAILLLIAFSANHSLLAKSVEKKRKIEKEFLVNSDATIDIENKYGQVSINTWKEDRVTLSIEITVEDKNEERAQDRLEDIEIEITADPGRVTAKTNIESYNSSNNGISWLWESWTNDEYGNNKMEINYTLYIPETNNIKIENKYGNVWIDDLLGEADIYVKYGNLDAGKLAGENTDIELGYGNAKIELMEEADVEAKYSNLEIARCRVLDLENKYSDVELGEIGELQSYTKYGSMEIDKVYSFRGDIQYTDLEIEEMVNSLDLEISYGSSLDVDYIPPGFESIDIDASYVSVNLNFDRNAGFELDAESSYGNIDWSGEFNFKTLNEEDSKYGTSEEVYAEVKGEGGKVSVDVAYGNLKLRKR